MTTSNSRAAIALFVPLLAFASCTTEPADSTQGKMPASLRDRFDREMHRVQLTEGPQLKSLLDGLAEFGPYATEPVKERLLASDTPRLRSNAVYVLSGIYRNDEDKAALDAVKSALNDGDPTVRLEAARALLELHDRSGINELVSALGSDRRGIRVPAFLALRHDTGNDFGYNPYDPPERRAEGVAKFRQHFGLAEEGAARAMTDATGSFAASPGDEASEPAKPAKSVKDEPAPAPEPQPSDSDLPTVPPAPENATQPASEPSGDGGDNGGAPPADDDHPTDDGGGGGR